MATIKEIAYLAGVSRGTVDRVLNNRGAVNPQTAQKVKEIAKAINYIPNRAGRTLAVKKKQLKFGFILFGSTSSNPFFLDMVCGIEDRSESLKEYGVTVSVRYAVIDNPDYQVQLIDELLLEGIDGLAITPINHPAVFRRLKKLTRSGFPVVTANSDIPDCGRIAYVGSNYYKSGTTAAGLMNLVCREGAKVGIVIGSPWVLCHSERVAGFTDHIKRYYPHIQVVDTVINNDDDLDSLSVTRKLLKAYPEIDSLYLAAAGVQGACRAVKDMNLLGKLNIISYDTTAPTRQLVEEGAIIATIAQSPFTQGSKPLDILMDYVGMGIRPEKEFYYTRLEIKIKENI
ncbi:LacI family DNA-binding transcriptional regulator [Oscillospiraceae bacterium MB08-C2-2]|nr:LacI family DNA-binding transcriptional regulator [Oscillospiraceae bacterium MB08-C2-2]